MKVHANLSQLKAQYNIEQKVLGKGTFGNIEIAQTDFLRFYTRSECNKLVKSKILNTHEDVTDQPQMIMTMITDILIVNSRPRNR